MPTYEYECTKCGHRFEVFQSMSDKPVKKCPECGKQVRRLVSGGLGVIFKGSGFYVTDKDKTNVPKGVPKTDGISKGDGASKESGAKADTASKGDGASKGGDAKADTSSKADTDSKAKGKAKPAA